MKTFLDRVMKNKLEPGKKTSALSLSQKITHWLPKVKFKIQVKKESAEAYLETSQTSTIELLCKNSLKSLNYFRKIAPS